MYHIQCTSISYKGLDVSHLDLPSNISLYIMKYLICIIFNVYLYPINSYMFVYLTKLCEFIGFIKKKI